MIIKSAYPEYASTLTEITISAKRHWNYPEKWIQLWLPSLTISPQYIQENETWMAVVDEKPVGYYSLKSQPVIARRLLRRGKHPSRNDMDSLWLDNLWVLPEFMGQGIGKQLFEHALERSRV